MSLDLHLSCVYCGKVCDDDWVEVAPHITAHSGCAAEKAARELWAALVIEWNGEDDPKSQRIVERTILRWRSQFGTDDAYSVFDRGQETTGGESDE